LAGETLESVSESSGYRKAQEQEEDELDEEGPDGDSNTNRV
jgi:hypothetical protein